jgi:hypothetical protein
MDKSRRHSIVIQTVMVDAYDRDRMNQKYIAWGLAITAFVATLGISSWHQGLWHSGEPVAQSRPKATEVIHIPARPFEAVASAPVRAMAAAAPPPVATPALAAATRQPPLPPPSAPPTDPQPSPATDSATDDTPSPVPDVDYEQFQAQAERAAEHSARSR